MHEAPIRQNVTQACVHRILYLHRILGYTGLCAQDPIPTQARILYLHWILGYALTDSCACNCEYTLQCNTTASIKGVLLQCSHRSVVLKYMYSQYIKGVMHSAHSKM